jgi:hypothetical protein
MEILTFTRYDLLYTHRHGCIRREEETKLFPFVIAKRTNVPPPGYLGSDQYEKMEDSVADDWGLDQRPFVWENLGSCFK